VAATLTKPGDRKVEDHGALHMSALLTHDGVSITVFCGPTRIESLTKPFPGRIQAARIWWAEITAMADSSLHVRDIEARMQALEAADHILTTCTEGAHR
jgi:hypothetical protein